jgi:hypothetical protein
MDDRAAGWTVLLSLASPAFVVNGASYYSMNAHLFANLAFVALILTPTPKRLALAGAVGGWALSLHNPLPHALFALPWLVSFVLSRPGWRRAAALSLGYVSTGAVLVGGWLALRAHLSPAETPGQSEVAAAFATVSGQILSYRAAGFAKLVLWSCPGLLTLAAIGAFRAPAKPVRLLAASFALTILAYLAVPFSQGHGWGYRYAHSAFGVLPLLAAGALAGSGGAPAAPSGRGRLLSAAIIWCFGSLLVGNGLRFVQVERFISRHLAARPSAPPGGKVYVFINPRAGYYAQDLIQNDPFLRSDTLYLMSYGPGADAFVMSQLAPGAALLSRSERGTVWRVSPGR